MHGLCLERAFGHEVCPLQAQYTWDSLSTLIESARRLRQKNWEARTRVGKYILEETRTRTGMRCVSHKHQPFIYILLYIYMPWIDPRFGFAHRMNVAARVGRPGDTWQRSMYLYCGIRPLFGEQR